MYDRNHYIRMALKSDMGREDWVYPNIPKELDEAVNEKLKKDPLMKKLGIWKSNDWYAEMARQYVKKD